MALCRNGDCGNWSHLMCNITWAYEKQIKEEIVNAAEGDIWIQDFPWCPSIPFFVHLWFTGPPSCESLVNYQPVPGVLQHLIAVCGLLTDVSHTHTHTRTHSVSCLMQYHQGRLEQLWDLHIILTSRQPNSQSNYHFNPYIKHSLMSNIFLPHTATKNTHTQPHTHTHTHTHTHNSTQLILLHSSSLQFL